MFMKDIELLHGDCLDLMKNIADNSVDMVLCDPPYGTTANKWDSIIPFDKMWKQLNRIIKRGGYLLVWFRAIFKCFKNEQYKQLQI